MIASGLHSPGGVCLGPDGQPWVTDRGADRDLLYKIAPGKGLGNAVWSWPDKPGVAGCVVTPALLTVATSTAGNMQNLPLNPEGVITGKPMVTMDQAPESFGKLGGIGVLSSSLAIVGTVNKDGGQPVSSDDRAFLMTLNPTSGGGGKD
ncbi:hypothetical protein GCM10029964_105780 [Kibdelosporangium lantanae]